MAVHFLIKITELLLLYARRTTEGVKIGKLQPILFSLVLIISKLSHSFHTQQNTSYRKVKHPDTRVRSSQNWDEWGKPSSRATLAAPGAHPEDYSEILVLSLTSILWPQGFCVNLVSWLRWVCIPIPFPWTALFTSFCWNLGVVGFFSLLFQMSLLLATT